MPLPEELAVVDLVWSIESGQEIAVNRIWMQHHHQEGAPFDWDFSLDLIAKKWVSSLDTTQSSNGNKVTSFMPNNVQLTRVDVYAVGTDGRANEKQTATATTGQVKGVGSTGGMPPQLAVVLQLWAYTGFVQHARRRRGRLFLPPHSINVLGFDGRVSASNRDAIRDSWAAVLNDVQGMHVGSSGGQVDWMNVGVLSRIDQQFHQLEGVTVAIDTGSQRRRINKLQRPPETQAVISHS